MTQKKFDSRMTEVTATQLLWAALVPRKTVPQASSDNQTQLNHDMLMKVTVTTQLLPVVLVQGKVSVWMPAHNEEGKRVQDNEWALKLIQSRRRVNDVHERG